MFIVKKKIFFTIFIIGALVLVSTVKAQETAPSEETRKGGSFANMFHFEFHPGKTDEALAILRKTLIPAYRNAGIEVTLIEDLLGTKDIFLVVPLKDGPAYYNFIVPKQDAEAWKQLIKLIGSAEKAEQQSAKVKSEEVEDAFYGLGHGVHRTKDGETIVYHSGGNPGVRAYFLVSVSKGNGMIVVANSDNGVPILKETLKLWGEYYNVELQPIY